MIGKRVMRAEDKSYRTELERDRGIVSHPLVCSKKNTCS